jgi:hypothetical protein
MHVQYFILLHTLSVYSKLKTQFSIFKKFLQNYKYNFTLFYFIKSKRDDKNIDIVKMRNVLLHSSRIDLPSPPTSSSSPDAFSVPGHVLAGDFDADGVQELLLMDIHGRMRVLKVGAHYYDTISTDATLNQCCLYFLGQKILLRCLSRRFGPAHCHILGYM